MMKNKLIDLVKESLEEKEKLIILESICELCETFRDNSSLEDMINSLYAWLNKKYNINKMTFAIYEVERDIDCIFFKEGDVHSFDDVLGFKFVIDTNTEQNGIITFYANDPKHHEKISKNHKYLETLFYQITPVMENAILRKLYLEHSSIDSVTNVYNREYLLKHIHKKISLAHDTEDTITFMMVGIDRFKAVIDEFDYDIGDKVLVELAKVIHGTIKSQDIVARLTGDEFLIAVLHTTDIDKITQKAQKIIDKFSKVEVVVDEETGQVLKKTICIGISSFPKDGNTLDEVIKNADKFLEEARNKGRGSYAVYEKVKESTIDLF